MSKIKYYVDLGILGEDVDCIVEYDYEPYQRQTYWCPACDSSFDVTDVTVTGVTLSKQFKDILIDELNSDETLRDKIEEVEREDEFDRAAARAEFLEDR